MTADSPDTTSYYDLESPCCIELVVVAGPHEGRTFVFARHDSFVVGRSRYAHFRLSTLDRYFSRIHFLIEVNPPRCRLFDMGSTNGTRVNGQRTDAIDLSDGDMIQAGHTSIRVAFKGNWRQSETHSVVEETSAREASIAAVACSPNAEVACESEPGQPLVTEVATSAESPAEIHLEITGYRLLREIGRGAMGVVYLAVRLADDRQVAVKVVRPALPGSQDEIQRFLREVSILRRLQHPHIVTLHKASQARELLFFVMDFVDGCDSESLMKQSGKIPVHRAVFLLCQVLDAIHYAHEQGFVHRDVKPANLLVRQTPSGGQCLLADFGLARAYHNSRMSGLTIAGDIGGTLPYTPPEQILNFRDAKPPADQYGAAATLYRLITGQFIFDFGSTPGHHRIKQIVYDEPVPIAQRLPEVSPELAEAIHRALRKDPAERFPDASAFRKAIAPFAIPRS